ncbi:MAG: hypothetical protein KBS54_00790 [Synergistaceae bacterium]|nr:hypothetical protein [Candidatus Equadaptatus faecalis]
MKKLSEYKNDEALDKLAELIEPLSEIFTDKKVVDVIKNGGNKIKVVSCVIKTHKKAIIEILAILDDVPVEQYECNLLTLPVALMSILNDKDLMDFLALQGQNMASASFGSVTDNTQGKKA